MEKLNLIKYIKQTILIIYKYNFKGLSDLTFSMDYSHPWFNFISMEYWNIFLALILILIYPILTRKFFQLNFSFISKFVHTSNKKRSKFQYGDYLSLFMLFFYLLLLRPLIYINIPIPSILENFNRFFLDLKGLAMGLESWDSIDSISFSFNLAALMLFIFIISFFIWKVYNIIKSDPGFFFSSKITFIFCINYVALIIFLVFYNYDSSDFLICTAALDLILLDQIIDRFFPTPVLGHTPDWSFHKVDEIRRLQIIEKLSKLTGLSREDVEKNVNLTSDALNYFQTFFLSDWGRLERGTEYIVIAIGANEKLYEIPYSRLFYANRTSDRIGIFEKCKLEPNTKSLRIRGAEDKFRSLVGPNLGLRGGEVKSLYKFKGIVDIPISMHCNYLEIQFGGHIIDYDPYKSRHAGKPLFLKGIQARYPLNMHSGDPIGRTVLISQMENSYILEKNSSSEFNSNKLSKSVALSKLKAIDISEEL